MPDAVIEFAVSTILRTIKFEDQRLKTGIALRKHLGAQISAGVEVEHYRIDWIRNTVGEVVEALVTSAKRFNRAHPADKISVADFVDVLLSTVEALREED